MQVLFLVSRSMIVHRVMPGGVCKLPVALKAASSSFTSTLRSAPLCSKVTVLPAVVTFALPVKVVPPQQKR